MSEKTRFWILLVLLGLSIVLLLFAMQELGHLSVAAR